jgi:HAD superfamily hydrolase (TIGR01450 family)
VDNPEHDIVDAVIVGLDFQFSYEKLYHAMNYVIKGAPLIGTNPDLAIPIPDGFAPGAGSILSAIESAAGRKATIIGKPGQYVFQLALGRTNTKPEQAIMIGDRLETDIKGAQSLGIKTGVVLSGVTSQEMVDSWSPAPDYVANDVEQMLDLLIKSHEE